VTGITCPRCGEPVAPGARYCPGCGADVSGQQGNVATAYVTAAQIARASMTQEGLLELLRQATLGEYEILGQLGQGGMATVYLAHEIALDRKVAVKLMSPNLLSGEGMVERFKREARTAASLSHPNIIPIYAVRESEHLVYFVMKFIEGRGLDSIIREVGPLPIPMVRAMLNQVGSALGYAHKRGIIHRDVKPANVMVDTDGWAVVTDFGIAKVTEAKGLTMTGATVGTPAYMSPEQCSAKDLTGASDQYSLGVVAYEMLAGKQPFVADSVMALMYAHFNEPPPPLREARPDCPPELAAAVMKMLAKEPGDRFPDLEAAVAAIGAVALAADDPVRTQLMSLAAKGTNATILATMHTPASPSPRVRPGTAQGAAAAGKAARTGAGEKGLSLSPAQVTVAVGGAVQLTARLKGSTGATLVSRAVTWASTEPSVATVSADGLVTAIAAGRATVTCTSEGASATAEVTVTPAHAGSRRLIKVGAALVVIAGIAVAAWRFGPWHPAAAGATGGPGAQKTDSIASAPPPAAQPGAPVATNPQSKASEPRETPPKSSVAAGDTAAERGPLRDLRAAARAARDEALAAGATPADLAPGDAERAQASQLATGKHPLLARAHFNRATQLWNQARDAARARTAQAAQKPAPAPAGTTAAPTPPPQPAPAVATAPADPRPLIDAAIQGYARALESRNVAQVRAAYPGLTGDQAQTWRDFFRSVTSLSADLRIAQLDAQGDAATAKVEGSFHFTQDHRDQQQPVNFTATLAREGAAWRITAIH